jgi:hypothetical protein
MRLDIIFSYWIFAWYLCYVFKWTHYSPKLALLFGLIENGNPLVHDDIQQYTSTVFFVDQYDHQSDSLYDVPTTHRMGRPVSYRGIVFRVFDLVESKWSILHKDGRGNFPIYERRCDGVSSIQLVTKES